MINENELYTAMAAAFAEIEGAAKDNLNPHFNAKYADLGSVVSAIKPALAKHGLWFRQMTHMQDGGICIETIVSHKTGGDISFGQLFVPAAKHDPQGYGSALTYARRYSLMTAFGVCPEDDDGNAAVKAGPAKQEPAKVISEAQRTELMLIFDTTGFPIGDFLSVSKIAGLKDLPAAKFDGAKGWINEQVQKMEKA